MYYTDALWDLSRKQIDEDHAVIVIDNSDITKPCSPMMEAISDVRDGSAGEIKKGHYTIEAAVLSKGKKMPMPVYEKVFSAAEEGFISETHENLFIRAKENRNVIYHGKTRRFREAVGKNKLTGRR